MDKNSLTADLKQSVKGSGFINISQLAKYLKKSRENTVQLLDGLDYVEIGREKKFFIQDVAYRIACMKKLG